MEVNREELQRLIDEGTEKKLAELLGEDVKAEDDKGEDETLSFANEQELNTHIQAEVQKILDEAGGGAEEDGDAKGKADAPPPAETEDKTDEKVAAAVSRH